MKPNFTRVKSFITPVIYFVFTCFLVAQDYNGVVLDKVTKQPLESVSVYLDGTTIGVVTNAKGEFNIDLNEKISEQSILVISFIGYKSLLITKANLKSVDTYFLEEKEESLDEVTLFDDWSRKKKLKIFRRQFLGFKALSSKCKILNEKDLVLVYNKNDSKLYASSKRPIVIENKSLGYLLTYDLVDFEITFTKCLECFNDTNIKSVYYSGTTKFEELHRTVKPKYKKAREKAFYGSLLHFMRALYQDDLLKEKFKLLINRSNDPKKKLYATASFDEVFLLNPSVNNVNVYLKQKDKVVILYNDFEQSALQITDENRFFTIDKYGIHFPVDKIIFGGRFGNSRIASMLPNNYYVD